MIQRMCHLWVHFHSWPIPYERSNRQVYIWQNGLGYWEEYFEIFRTLRMGCDHLVMIYHWSLWELNESDGGNLVIATLHLFNALVMISHLGMPQTKGDDLGIHSQATIRMMSLVPKLLQTWPNMAQYISCSVPERTNGSLN